MSTTFPRVRKSRQGYRVSEVEDFLEEARRAYEADRGPEGTVTAETIRRAAFAMERGGYATAAVDSALERLEDAFAQRERERAYSEIGNEEWFGRARATAQEILARLSRPKGGKFVRARVGMPGYHRGDVDAFMLRLQRYFQEGKQMEIDDVRTVAFRSRSRGYSEPQVDLLLDSVIDVMLAVRQ